MSQSEELIGKYLVWMPSRELSAADRAFVRASLPAFNQASIDFDLDHVYYSVVADVGYLSGRLLFGELEIYQVYVAPDWRRQGWGGRLVEAVQARPEIDRIILEVRRSNLPARFLYEKMHFSQISIRENYYENPREDAVIMEWRRDND